ncbi:ATP-binding cassette domain-containing protein [Serratia rubidaea]|uniref:ATP-binding cassette domain-containing protein n=1 Tax=Serratia rubidaea TaxID=61652 RepID=A0ABS0MDF4_SERRU|nr:ATP-binding cassette domain-containing protein [Serratia rubidaea]MBH1930405.1 ATP-binding cassette domain-containing protein [Serratia rubidaea]MEB7587854.1 ATP-binding cassette domain-containing protein [Serratia rubidaea]
MVAQAAQTQITSAGITIDVQNVSHSFALDNRDIAVLDNISLSIAAGESVSLLGPSGCGKSTLLRLLAGLEARQSGRLLADAQPIDAPSLERILVFQDPTLYPWRTVRQNVLLGPQAQRLGGQEHKADGLISRIGLGEFAHAYPRQLSGGMAQRAALARALLNEPRLLLLDEPLGKLDSLTRIGMQRELINLWQSRGYTSLLVTHDVEEALLLSDRVIVLSPRPSRILAQFTVPLAYPRHRDDPLLIRHRQDILKILGQGIDW